MSNKNHFVSAFFGSSSIASTWHGINEDSNFKLLKCRVEDDRVFRMTKQKEPKLST